MSDRFNSKKTVQDNNPYAEVEFSDEEDDNVSFPKIATLTFIDYYLILGLHAKPIPYPFCISI